MKQEYDVNFIWDSLGDFWRLFEDAEVIDQLWRGYIYTVNNLYYQLYQLDLSKCIHTIPHRWVSDWELFIFDSNTRIEESTPTYAEYPYTYSLPYGVKNVSLLRESPRETVVLPHGTILTPDDILVLPDGTQRYLGDTLYYPESAIIDGDYMVFPEGITVDTLKLHPDNDYIVDESTLRIHFKEEPYTYFWSNLAVRDLEIIYDNFGSLLKYYKPDSYKYLREVQGLWYAYWNGSTISNIEIGINILRDLPFVLEDGIVEDVSYTSTIVTIGGNTINVTKAQAEVLSIGETVEYIDVPSGVVQINGTPVRIKSSDAELLEVGDAITEKRLASTALTVSGRDYSFTGEQTVDISIGEYVDKFTPLTTSVGVYDYINYPGWWKDYIGPYSESEQSCFFDGDAFFDAGFFDLGIFDATYTERCLEAIFLQYFTFLVRLDSSAWFCSKEDLDVIIAFLYAIKPTYTHFLFEFMLDFRDDTVTHDSDFHFGNWNYVPTDIPVDHHIFDMEAIHPTFDDGAYFDFDKERDYLCISVYGSPHIFYDDDVRGYTFDDVAVPEFDYEGVAFDTGPYDDTFEIELTTKVPAELQLNDAHDTIDSDISLTLSEN